MAEPGLTELVTTTARLRSQKAKDNISNFNPVLHEMDKHGAITKEAGGRTIVKEMLYAEMGNFTRFHGGEQVNINTNPVATAAEFEWKEFSCALTITNREKNQNAGKYGLIKLVTMRMKACEATLKNNLNADMLSDGTADSGKQVGGLKLLVAKTPTTGTVGGIDRSTSGGAFYQNYKFDTSADWASGAASSANIKQLYNKLLNNTMSEDGGPTMIIAGLDHYEFLQIASQAIQEITDPKRASLGFKFIEFAGIPVYLGKGLTFGSQTLIQDDLSYFLNTRQDALEFCVHKDTYMTPMPWVRATNQFAEVRLIATMGNMALANAKSQAVLYDS